VPIRCWFVLPKPPVSPIILGVSSTPTQGGSTMEDREFAQAHIDSLRDYVS
jgi:hypothetical protein